jgi:hypothetical protein
VKELSGENSELKAKILELKEGCQNVETENKQLMVSSYLASFILQKQYPVFSCIYNK